MYTATSVEEESFTLHADHLISMISHRSGKTAGIIHMAVGSLPYYEDCGKSSMSNE